MSDRHPALDALLDGRLTGDQRRAAYAHLDGCATCRAEYERLVLAGRALAGDDLDRPSVAEREAMLRSVLAEVAPPPSRPRVLWFGLPAVAVAAAALVLLWPRDAGFVEKGRPGQTSATARAFCVEPGQTRQLTSAVACPRGATLVVSARQPGNADLQPTLCLVDAAGMVHPALPARIQPAFAAGPGEQVIDAYIDLDARVAVGPAKLYLIWCAHCEPAATAAMLEAARAGQLHGDAVQTIDVTIGEGAP